MERFARDHQRKILEELLKAYPQQQDFCQAIKNDPTGEVARNLHYLDEHGMIAAHLETYVEDPSQYGMARARITAAGIDFMRADGGLSAILGTVTVKLHEDTLRQLLEAQVQRMSIPDEDKKGWLQVLRDARGDAIGRLVEKLIDAGWSTLSPAPSVLGTLLRQFVSGGS